jgi:hypothetical protein
MGRGGTKSRRGGIKNASKFPRRSFTRSQSYAAAEIEMLHLSACEWHARFGGCVPIENDVNVAAVVRAWNPRLTMPTWDWDLRQWLGIAGDDHT